MIITGLMLAVAAFIFNASIGTAYTDLDNAVDNNSTQQSAVTIGMTASMGFGSFLSIFALLCVFAVILVILYEYTPLFKRQGRRKITYRRR